MNKSSLIRKLGAILQTKKATKEEVKEAYENSNLMPCKEDGWISLEEQKPPMPGRMQNTGCRCRRYRNDYM